jgi:hypothetical protein
MSTFLTVEELTASAPELELAIPYQPLSTYGSKPKACPSDDP